MNVEARQPEVDRAISLRDIVGVLFRYKVRIFLILLSSLLVSFFYIAIAEEVYESSVRILVKLGREKVTEVNAYSREPANFVFQERTQNINNEIQILKSESLMRETALELMKDEEQQAGENTQTWKSNLKRQLKKIVRPLGEPILDALSWIGFRKLLTKEEVFINKVADSLRLEYLEESDVILVSFRWNDPKVAAHALNAHISGYLSRHVEIHGTEKSEGFYSDQIPVYEEKLGKIEQTLSKFVTGKSISNISLQKEVLVKDLAELGKRIMDLTARLDALAIKIRNLKDVYEKTDDWIETQIAGRDTTEISDLKKLDEAYFNLLGERNRHLGSYKIDATREAQGIDLQIRKLRKQKYDSLINILTIEKSAEESRKNSFEKILSSKKRQLDGYIESTMPLEQLQRTRELMQGELSFYRKKAEEFRVLNDLDRMKITSVKVLDQAQPPILPIYPKKSLILGLSGLLGLLLGIAYMLISEFFDHTFKTPENILERLQLSPLAAIPRLSPRQTSLAAMSNEGGSTITVKTVDSLEHLYTRIQLPAIDSTMPPVSLCVTSCSHGEGVSFVARNLAKIIARHVDGIVLLADGNMENPSILHIYGTSSTDTADLVYEPAVLGNPKVFMDLVKSWRGVYKVIIFDMPPIRTPEFSFRLASQVNGVILVVEAEHKRWEVVNEVKGSLLQMNANLIGAVLNKRQFHIPEWIYRRL